MTDVGLVQFVGAAPAGVERCMTSQWSPPAAATLEVWERRKTKRGWSEWSLVALVTADDPFRCWTEAVRVINGRKTGGAE